MGLLEKVSPGEKNSIRLYTACSPFMVFGFFFYLRLNLFLFWYRSKKYLKLLNCIQEERCLGKNTKLDDILNHLEKAFFFF